MFLRSFASEFPHDNPALSEGVVWTCPSPCARALPLREPEPPAPGALVFGPPGAVEALAREEAAPPRPIAAVRASSGNLSAAPPSQAAAVLAVEAPALAESVPADRDAAENVPADSARPEPEDAFSRLVRALSDVALHAGATRVAASLPGMFTPGRAAASPDGVELDATGRELVSIGAAWRDVLSGASSDLNACGARTLDEWGADLLCALLRRPRSESRDLRQKLRARGVAAFGLRDAA